MTRRPKLGRGLVEIILVDPELCELVRTESARIGCTVSDYVATAIQLYAHGPRRRNTSRERRAASVRKCEVDHG